MLHNLLISEINRIGPLVGQCKQEVLNMAYIQKRKHPSGALTYGARIRLKGAPEMSESFPSRKYALAWASRIIVV